uniref:Uncharacterized protein n=1 Tax=Physcomitrium patens TaxID=3218 RepID=A0A2K1ISI0_PHYPA|nr:hypothetical protein PHYPA_026359 [Physcomitrium patens]
MDMRSNQWQSEQKQQCGLRGLWLSPSPLPLSFSGFFTILKGHPPLPVQTKMYIPPPFTRTCLSTGLLTL